MMHQVAYVGWSSGEVIVRLDSPEPPYVPQLKTCVVVEGVRYIVGGIDSELVPAERGMDVVWAITVKLAKS